MSAHNPPHNAPDNPFIARPEPEAEQIVSVTEGYALWAESYDHFANPMTFLVEQQLLSLLAKPAAAAGPLVELGCGTGRNLQQLLRYGVSDVLGLDVSAAMLDVARAKLTDSPARLIQHDLNQPLPLAAMTVRTVLISLVLEHLDSIAAIIAEAARVLRSGGDLLIFEIHPFQRLSGRRAHCTDAQGSEHYLPSFPHLTKDYIHAAHAAGLRLSQIEEYQASSELIAAFPKLGRYGLNPIVLGLKFIR